MSWDLISDYCCGEAETRDLRIWFGWSFDEEDVARVDESIRDWFESYWSQVGFEMNEKNAMFLKTRENVFKLLRYNGERGSKVEMRMNGLYTSIGYADRIKSLKE